MIFNNNPHVNSAEVYLCPEDHPPTPNHPIAPFFKHTEKERILTVHVSEINRNIQSNLYN
jgi:hypothetical protein